MRETDPFPNRKKKSLKGLSSWPCVPMIYKTLDVKLLSFTARKKWSKLLSATETYNRLDLKILKRGRQKLKKIPKQIENIKYNLSI